MSAFITFKFHLKPAFGMEHQHTACSMYKNGYLIHLQNEKRALPWHCSAPTRSSQLKTQKIHR
jgi:hypothetical protein